MYQASPPHHSSPPCPAMPSLAGSLLPAWHAVLGGSVGRKEEGGVGLGRGGREGGGGGGGGGGRNGRHLHSSLLLPRCTPAHLPPACLPTCHPRGRRNLCFHTFMLHVSVSLTCLGSCLPTATCHMPTLPCPPMPCACSEEEEASPVSYYQTTSGTCSSQNFLTPRA